MGVFLNYWFWLAVVSVFCLVLERLFPWRPQPIFRKQFAQDLFWLVFNGHILGLGMAMLTGRVVFWLNGQLGDLGIAAPESLQLIHAAPLALQFVAFLVLKDFVEWCVHNLLHSVPWLWEFHKVHHTITTLDWIGNMRFHWMEVIVYKTISYLPLVILGVDGRVILWVAIFGTLIGHLNHSNVPISWGPLRYVLNSPRMHVWHHDTVLHGGHGQNFGIIFSSWDWMFGTAYMPRHGQPEQLGFDGIEVYPTSLAGRFLYPFSLFVKRTRSKAQLLILVVLLMPACTATSASFQEDADIVRLRHLKYYGALLEEYRQKKGSYPFEGLESVPVYVHFAHGQQVEQTKNGPPYAHRVIPASEFFDELQTVLGREIDEYYDPQYVGVYKPTFYIYLVNQDTFFFAVHTYQPFPFATNVAEHYNKVEISNNPTSRNLAKDPAELFSDPAFNEVMDRKLSKSSFFAERDELHRRQSRQTTTDQH